jgi:integrase
VAYAEKRGKGEYPWRVKFKRPDGKEDQASGFRTKTDALNYGRDQEADVRHGRFHDRRRGDVLLDDYFWRTWLPAQRLSDKSKANRKGEYRTHIGPRWGQRPLNTLDPFEIQQFENELYAAKSQSTAGNVMELLRFMCDDAVFAKMLEFSPVPPKQRRGQKRPSDAREGIAVDLATVEAIRARLPAAEAMLVLATAFTGMRWGEAIGLRRSFLTLTPAVDGKPAAGRYVIDDEIGAIHEDERGRRFFGPPKLGKGRTVELPPFLVVRLLAYLETFPRERDLLFVNRGGEPLRRSGFSKETTPWRRACDGWPARDAVHGHPALLEAPPVHAGLVFRDLRHTHKTWLAEDGIEPVARDERLGHATPGIDGVYIHATSAMRKRILGALERRWSQFQKQAEKRSPICLPESGSRAA